MSQNSLNRYEKLREESGQQLIDEYRSLAGAIHYSKFKEIDRNYKTQLYKTFGSAMDDLNELRDRHNLLLHEKYGNFIRKEVYDFEKHRRLPAEEYNYVETYHPAITIEW